MWFVRFLELTAIFSLHVIKWFAFVVETRSVFHEIQTHYLNTGYLKFLLRSVKFKTWFCESEGSVVNGKIQLAGAGVAALTVTTVVFHSLHLVVCLTTGPKPLPKRALHIVRSRAFSFKWEYPLLSLKSSNSFLRLLPCLPVTSIPPCIFPSVTRCRRQFLRKMWPI